jgi:hypothetical protein
MTWCLQASNPTRPAEHNGGHDDDEPTHAPTPSNSGSAQHDAAGISSIPPYLTTQTMTKLAQHEYRDGAGEVEYDYV